MTDSVAYRGPSDIDGSPIRVIVTGMDRPSSNRKTGAMAQVWILPDNILPLEAMRTGADVSVCGNCPLRGTVEPDGRRSGRACYVNVGQAPQGVARKDERGGYAEGLEVTDLPTRLGAWGEPTAAPYGVMDTLAGDVWTGYTHRWPTVDPEWSGLLMASVESLEAREEAHALGYRTFRVGGPDEEPAEREVLCPATRAVNPLHCVDCGMCSGTRRGTTPGRVDVFIRAHGNGAKYV